MPFLLSLLVREQETLVRFLLLHTAIAIILVAGQSPSFAESVISESAGSKSAGSRSNVSESSVSESSASESSVSDSPVSDDHSIPPVLLSISPAAPMQSDSAAVKKVASKASELGEASELGKARELGEVQGTTLAAQVPPGSASPATKSSYSNSRYGLSDDTYEMAKLWGILPALEVLKQNPKHLTRKQLDLVIKRVVIQQEVNEAVMAKMFDVRTTLNAIDRQIAESQEVRARLAERRDRAIRFNTYADLVAGGVTGILSGALRLGELKFVVPDVVDIVEGVAEGGLAGLALRNENIKHDLEQGVPNLLAKMFYPHQKHLREFPDSVWNYLNTVPANSKTGLSRREELVEDWESNKFCLIHGQKHNHVRLDRRKHVSGISKSSVSRLTIGLLEDRAAMLQDLRAVVTMMEEHLAEIYRVYKQY